MDPLVALSSGYAQRLSLVQYELFSWSLIIKPNPSRWHLLICVGTLTGACLMPYPNFAYPTEGITLGGKNYVEFKMSDSPALVTSAWYVRIEGLIPASVVWAIETTPVGT